MGPTRKKYDALFLQHKQAQTRYDKNMDKITSHRTTYQRHKQYLISLSNALLASNITLRSAPRPISDSQALTHATLLNDLRLASYTLTTLIFQNKRLDKARDASWTRDQELYAKCQDLFVEVERGCRELDRLHAEVLEAEKKMGLKPACGMAEGKCVPCIRAREREARKVAAEKVAKGREGVGRKGDGSEVKQRLENIFEEVE